MKDIWQWIFKGGGALVVVTILTFAGKYLVGQEVSEQIAPMEAEYEQFSATVSQMQFEERNAVVMTERDECMEDYPVDYCDEVAAWRWNVWYDYLGCASRVERYDEREDACGPVPVKPAPPEEIDP